MKKIKHSTTFSFHREKTDTKTELLLSLTTSSTSKSTFDSSNMSAIPKIGKQLISFILTNYNKILPFCSTIQDSLLIDLVIFLLIATVYKGNIIKNLIMDCQSYAKYRPNETTGGIFVSWRRKEELPTGLD